MTSSRPQVSVVIQFLNSERYLEDTIRSVLWQTFPHWELVLVDGGSSDRSVDIARSYVTRLSGAARLLAHHGPSTLGIFPSRLWGASEAGAPILAHLDSDDEWHPRFLEMQIEVFRSTLRDRPGMVYGPMAYTWGATGFTDAYVQPTPKPGVHEPPALLIELLKDGYAKSPGNSAVMVSRDVVLDAASLSNDAVGITEDQFLCSFIALRYPIVVNPEPLVRYRQWPGSACARSVADGEVARWRSHHLQWLHRHIASISADDLKARLLNEVDAAAAIDRDATR